MIHNERVKKIEEKLRVGKKMNLSDIYEALENGEDINNEDVLPELCEIFERVKKRGL